MNSSLFLTRKLLAACAVTMAASAAHADITVFTDRAAFLNAVSGSATDTFDDLAMVETGSPLSRLAGAYTYQVSAGPGDSGFYPSGSGGDIWLSGTMSSDVITFNAFSSGVFGFCGNFFGFVARGIQKLFKQRDGNRQILYGYTQVFYLLHNKIAFTNTII